jgi:MoaA/NifB/PqqE/SkfB family radical SAM enzyme
MSDIQIQNNYTLNELVELHKSGCDVYLYGAGGGASSYDKLAFAALNYIKITPKAYLDDDERKYDRKQNNLKIYPPTLIKNLANKVIVIISSNYFESIAKNLQSLDVSNLIVFTCTSLLKLVDEKAFIDTMDYEEVQRRIHMHNAKFARIQSRIVTQKALSLNILDVQVTERCTMKCIDCSNLMQYYEKPKNADTNLLETSLTKILDAVDEIYELRLLGGEPFLYKELDKVIDIASKNNKVHKIIVYTNATFIPNNEILISLMHEKVLVEITDYVGQSKAKEKLITKMEEMKIRYICHLPQNWTDSARIVQNNKSELELNTMFERCCVNDVMTLLHGKIYHCPFSANVHNLKAIETTYNDYVAIEATTEVAELRDSIKKFYFGKNYLKACKFCLGRDFTQAEVIPAIQTKHAIKIPIVTSL